MPLIAYVDCFSGLSGDMFLGALLDVGLPERALREALHQVPVAGYRLSVEAVTRQGVSGHAARVRLENPADEPHRNLVDIVAIVEKSGLDPVVRERAGEVFRRLAEAEAAVHGIAVDKVHFHEVGAVDAIVDVVGSVWGLHHLGVETVYASPLPTGSGTVETAHGLLPVPAPATLALLAAVQAPLRPSPAQSELVTPTGAALLATLATFEQPRLRLTRVGYGFGQKTFPWPNVARLWLGEAEAGLAAADAESDTISVIETNLDDERPNVIGAAMEALLAAGALDVYFTPIQMKKNRPAVKVTVLAPPEKTRALSETLLRETATLGVRVYPAERLKARRSIATVDTPWGEVRVKVKEFGGERRGAPEYEDCRARAEAAGVPVGEVYRAALSAAEEGTRGWPRS